MRNLLVSEGWYLGEVDKRRHGSTRDILASTNEPLCFFQYPYIPAHITKPKEHKKLFLVQLQEKGKLFCFRKPPSKNFCRIISRTLLCLFHVLWNFGFIVKLKTHTMFIQNHLVFLIDVPIMLLGENMFTLSIKYQIIVFLITV